MTIKWVSFCLSWMSVSAALAQDSIPLYSDALARQRAAQTIARRPWLGADLTPVGWWLASAVDRRTPAHYSLPVSAILYLPSRSQRPEHNWFTYVSVGYRAYAGTVQRTIYQQGGSVHLRLGREDVRNRLLMGYGGLLSVWSGEGSLTFSGPVFGVYQEPIGRIKGFSVGAEGYIGYYVPLNPRLALRTQLRASLSVQNRSDSRTIPPPRQSGVDWSLGSVVSPGVSVGANLVYRL